MLLLFLLMLLLLLVHREGLALNLLLLCYLVLVLVLVLQVLWRLPILDEVIAWRSSRIVKLLLLALNVELLGRFISR